MIYIITSLIVIFWLWQLFVNRKLKRYNDYILRDAQQYRSLYERCLNDLKNEEKHRANLNALLDIQENIIKEMEANNMDVVDPETVTVCKQVKYAENTTLHGQPFRVEQQNQEYIESVPGTRQAK